ncbi:MAG TPA: DMT family transporter [Actinomycetota bacterium]|jgi:transporter family-2 protein
MSSTTFAIVLSLIAGIAGAAQAGLSSALGRRMGVLEATAFGALLGAAIMTTMAIVFGRGASGILSGFRQPPWLWTTAVMGALILTTLTFAPSRIGTFAAIGLIIVGQLAAGLLIDANGWFGGEAIRMTGYRLAGLIMLGSGALLILKR